MKRLTKIALFVAIPVVVAGSVLLYNYLNSSAKKSVEGQTAPSSARQGAGMALPVTIYVADFIKLDQGKQAIGTLLPNEQVDIASEVSGKIESISFKEGSRVRKGDVLVKVNDDDLQSQLKRASFQRDMLKERLNRGRILLDKDAVSREAFDQIETDYNMIEADIQLLGVRIDKTSIKAPFDGVVGFRFVSPGSYLQPGTRIAHLVDNSPLKIEFSISEKFYSESLKGTNITFTTENEQITRTAQIYAIDPTVDEVTRNVVMRALYNNTGMTIVPGMMVRVVVGQKSGSSLQIPTEAVVPDATTKKVWLVRQGKAHLQDIDTGLRTENMIEVTSGLVAGDSVVVTGLMQIREGSQLKINNP